MRHFLIISLFFSFVFGLNAKVIYIDPLKNARYVSIDNNIIIGFDERITSTDLNSLLRVTGTKSGSHTGGIILSPDGMKLIFKPARQFAFGEQVEVKLTGLKTSSGSNTNLHYTFNTESSRPENSYREYSVDESEYETEVDHLYRGSYSLLPQLTVTISNNPSPGRIFLNTFETTNYPPHLIIANNDGTQDYTRELSNRVANYERQPNGLMTYFYGTGNKFYGENSQHAVVDSFYCGNGLVTDSHELLVLNNGHAYVMNYNVQIIDMSQIVQGGQPNARVTGLIIQEIDQNKNVVFQWRSWDYFSILDAQHVNFTAQNIDYVHGNAMELDNDGNLLISSRHLNEITKINTKTGAIIWRMGGANNQFTFVNDTLGFSYQHNIRRIANGNITLFDNGNFRPPLFSRAVEYQLNETSKIATLVWQYRHTPTIYSPNRGSVQRLRNGNTLIGWGGTNPTLTEVTSAGTIVLEMNFPLDVYSYRAFRDEARLTLNAKIAIEGFYNTQANRLNIRDTVRAYIRSNVSPYGIVDSAIAVVDSVNFNGNFRFYNVSSGTYYISLKHRNALETWSRSGGETYASGDVAVYDFTSSGSQAYGNNLKLKGSKYCIFSGDVNGNGSIDAADLSLVDNAASAFVSGYVRSDVDGNNFVDAADIGITDNNAFNFVGRITPP